MSACVCVYVCVRVCLCVGVVRGVDTLDRFPATAQVIKDEENHMISLIDYMNSQSAGLAETNQPRVSHTTPREITLVTYVRSRLHLSCLTFFFSFSFF